jgi:Met-zincin/Domain of unknown function (DUF5117)
MISLFRLPGQPSSRSAIVWIAFLSFLITFLSPPVAGAQELPSIEAATETMELREGFFNVFWDDAAGKVWLEVPATRGDFLLVVSLPAGLGSNDVGLDRNQLGGQKIVHFERIGPRLYLKETNLRFRADSDNPDEKKAVADAFADGIVFGFDIAARTEDRLLVDATSFVVRDARGVVRTLRGRGQGSFKLDRGRSALWPQMLKSFPRNTELEAQLTFVSDKPGRGVSEVAADAQAVVLRVRQSLIELPPPGYSPRLADPRSGFFGISYADYATPIGEDLRKRFIARHRLVKKDPDLAISEAVEPIVYYLDRGTPEPVRSALLEGAGWWNQAFEAAGFKNAFRVEVLPTGADPLDVRYNMINWVHRSTRGWSYGSSVTDPRTGEIIKGHVLLGSLRVRQDYLIAEGLLSPYDSSSPDSANGDPMLDMALARIRQLSAHEVGHTLGLQHNFAASMNERASVMDYPAPLATVLSDGHISVDSAYATGIGDWDKVTIQYGYTQFPDSVDERSALQGIIDSYIQEGKYFLTDADARPPGAAEPRANLWDNGTNPIVDLEREMAVRRAALKRFGLSNIRQDRPLATLEEVLVPLYLHNRYQIDATVKMIGGTHYSYALRGDRQSLPEPIPALAQRKALETVLKTITPKELELPAGLRTGIPPRPPGFSQHRELFGGYTGLIFDPYAPAEVLALQVLGLIVQPERASRLVNQHDFDRRLPGLLQVLTDVSGAVWEQRIARNPYQAELQRVVQRVWTDVLLERAASTTISPAARVRIVQHLKEIEIWLEDNPGASSDRETVAHRATIYDEIDRYVFRPFQISEKAIHTTTPPGSPIGSESVGFQYRQQRREAIWAEWERSTRICAFTDQM